MRFSILILFASLSIRPSLPLSPDQLLSEARRYNQVTPLQVSLLYQLCDLDQRRGSISPGDFTKLVPRPSFSLYPPLATATATGTTTGAKVCVCVGGGGGGGGGVE